MAKAYLVVKKVTVVPVAGEANTLYLLQDGTKLRLYLSNADGTAVNRIIDETDVNSLISTILGLISGQADGLATLDTNSKVVQTALKSDKWSSAITLLLKGDVNGSVTIDGSGNVELFTQKPHSPVLSYYGDELYKAVYNDGSVKIISYSGDNVDAVTKTLGEKIYLTKLNYDTNGRLISAPTTEITQGNMLSVCNVEMDFTSAFPSQLSFTRNSVQERTAPDGLKQLMAVNSPCIDYTLQGAPLGLLIEPAETNLLNYSNQNDNWQKLSITVNDNSQIGVDGAMSASTLFETTSNDIHGNKSQPLTIVAGATYTFITKLKYTNRTYFKLELGDPGDDFTNCFLIAKLATMEVLAAVNLVRHSMVLDSNGFVQVSITAVAAKDSTTAYADIWFRDDTNSRSYVGDTSKSIIVANSMVLMNSVIDTGYIPTGNAPALRASQLVSVSGEDFNEVIGSSGTILVEALSKIIPEPSNQIILSLDDGTSANAVRLVRKNLTTVTLRITVSSSTTDVDATIPSSLLSKMVLIWNNSYFQLWCNGQLVHTFNNLSPVIDRLRMGSGVIGSTFIGYIKKLRVWRNAMLTSTMAQQLSI